MTIPLPVPVLDVSHWRINFRPHYYEENLISSLDKCFEIIEHNKANLRDWDYPHLSTDNRTCGKNWVASWSTIRGTHEYWRFYQSGQFLHLFNVREVNSEWRDKIITRMSRHCCSFNEIKWENFPGFISIINFISQLTEIYEFAARLCDAQIYKGKINIKIELKKINGFALVYDDWDFVEYVYQAPTDILAIENNYNHDVLIANKKDEAIKTIISFFKKFGWNNPSIDFIKQNQEDLYKRII